MANDIIKKAEKKYAIDLSTYKLSKENVNETLVGLALWKDFFNRVRETTYDFPILNADSTCKPNLLKETNFSFTNHFATDLLPIFRRNYLDAHYDPSIDRKIQKKQNNKFKRLKFLEIFKVLKYFLSIGLAVLIYYLVNGWKFNIGTFFAGAAALIVSFVGFYLIQIILEKGIYKINRKVIKKPDDNQTLQNDENYKRELEIYRESEKKKYLEQVEEFNKKSKAIKEIKNQISSIFDLKDYCDEKWVDSCFHFLNNGMAKSYADALIMSRDEDFKKKVIYGLGKNYEAFNNLSDDLNKHLDKITDILYAKYNIKK